MDAEQNLDLDIPDTHKISKRAPRPTLGDDEPTPSRLGDYSGRIYFAGCALGQIISNSGLPFFSSEGRQWIKSKVGDEFAYDKLCAFGLSAERYRAGLPSLVVTDPAQSHSCLELPDRIAMGKYMLAYRNSAVRFSFPVVEPRLFEDTIDMVYNSSPETAHTREVISAKANIFAFLSYVSLYGLDKEDPLPADPQSYAAKSQSLTSSVAPMWTLECLQTSVILVGLCIQ